MKWKDKTVSEVEILSRAGNICRIDAGGNFKVIKEGKRITSKTNKDGSIEFNTIKGGYYKLIRL
jgi:hypothetical protein